MFRYRIEKPPKKNVLVKGSRVTLDEDILFVGPITVRELKLGVELENKRRTERMEKNKLQAQANGKENSSPGDEKFCGFPQIPVAQKILELKKMLLQDQKEINEKVNRRNPLSEVNDQKMTANLSGEGIESVKPVLQSLTIDNVAQLNNETQNASADDSSASNHTYTLENSDSQSPTHVLNSTYDKIDETEDTNVEVDISLKPNTSQKATQTPRKSLLRYRQNSCDTSKVDVDETSETTLPLDTSKGTSCINKSVLSRFSNLELDDERASLTNISMTPLIDTPVPKMIKEYLTPPVNISRKSKSTGIQSRKSSLFTAQNSRTKSATTTPRKMSSTLITDLKPEQCLLDGSLRSSTGTPEIFRSNKSTMWDPKKSNNTTQALHNPPKSKLPQPKKTPSKYDSVKSPVARYIRQGIDVQSMSKLRHAACSFDYSGYKCDSESKIPTKIPQPRFHTNVKKKLKLDPKVNISASSSGKRSFRLG